MDLVQATGGVAAPTVAPMPAPAHRRLPLLLCLSHLRWNFVFQRPQHLLTRAARTHRILFFEEPLFRGAGEPALETALADGVEVATPILPEGLDSQAINDCLEALLGRLLAGERPAIAWYYTPMAMEFAGALEAGRIVYDNMDELALFHGADSRIVALEEALMARADVVFTGGHSLYEAKADRHANIHPMPSSVDVAHFAAARAGTLSDPADQAGIAGPRIGFFGVIDERMDMALLDAVAALRPDLQFVMLGPVVKIDPASCPSQPNIHWLGGKTYAELPAYMAHWDAGFMPFAINDATRFISPTKTPEYLAAGVPVVSTPIRDVIRPWGDEGLVPIAGDAPAVSDALDQALRLAGTDTWTRKVEKALSRISWDRTWAAMLNEIEAAGAAAGSTRKEAKRHA